MLARGAARAGRGRAPGRARRAPRSARRARSAPARRQAPGRWRCAGARRPTAPRGERRAKAGSRSTSCEKLRATPAVAFAAPADAVDVERQPDAGADAAPRVERGQRVLLDELDGAAKRPGRGAPAARSPSKRERPGGRRKRPRMMLPSVVLPEPDSPTMAWQLAALDRRATRRRARRTGVAAGAKRLAETDRSRESALMPPSLPARRSRDGRPAATRNPGLRSGIRGRPPPRMCGTAASSARV